MCGLLAVRDNPVGFHGREPEVSALPYNRAAARSTGRVSQTAAGAITSVRPYANAEEDIHDSPLETNNS
jgi:hypothetical protein